MRSQENLTAAMDPNEHSFRLIRRRVSGPYVQGQAVLTLRIRPVVRSAGKGTNDSEAIISEVRKGTRWCDIGRTVAAQDVKECFFL